MPVPTPTAYPTTGATLGVGDDDSPEGYDRIGVVGDISDVGFTATLHDTSTHDTDDGFASQIPGLKKQDDVTLSVNYQPLNAQQSFDVEGGLGWLALQNPPVLKRWILFPAGFQTKAVTFLAYVTKVGTPMPVDGVLKLNLTLARTGAPVYGVDATSLMNT